MRNLLHTLRRIFSDKGLLLTLALSLVILAIFYGKLLLHPCTTYFSAGGDGLQIYYETLYHTKFDPEFWRQQSINYPYGESIFFTGAMPFVNNLVKIFGPSAAPLGVGLINLLMLFSPVIGALVLYAIFRHLRLPWLYGALAATFIAFLSPQLGRFSGHYSLSWVFLIPAMIYLLLRFYDYPSLTKSLLISFLVFLGATTHLYFLAFFAALGGIYWAMLFLTRDRGFGRFLFVLKHAGIQFVLPVVLIQVLVMWSDTVPDRTVAPWGYLVYHSSNSGVFFPFGKPYADLVQKFITPAEVELEGVAYVGLAAITGLVAIALVQLYRLVRGRFRLLLSVTDHKVLNIFFWTSLFLLWVSYAEPFAGGNEEWLVHAGPLRQFRAIGRFTWVFFYVMNIIAVYRLYKIALRKNFLRYAIMVIIPALLFLDMYYNVRGQQDIYNNRIADLEDETNTLPQNAWLKNFKPSDYQAILPLPFFHIGSENVSRIPGDQEIIRATYIVSLKTGLPTMAATSGRTSISQSLKLVSLVLDPLRPVPVLAELPDKRPLLLVVRPETLDENERRILDLANPVGTSEAYQLYSILPATLDSLARGQYETVKAAFAGRAKFPAGKFLATDSAASVFYNSFDAGTGKAFRGKGSYSGSIRAFSRLYDSTLAVPGEYVASFWINNIDKDVYPRLVIEVFVTDPAGKAQAYYFQSNAIRELRAVDGSWGLVEFPLTVPAENSHAQITVWNSDMRESDQLQADELLIRPENTDLYEVSGDTIIRNTRKYFPVK